MHSFPQTYTKKGKNAKKRQKCKKKTENTGPIGNATYKKNFGKIGDFDGDPYKKQFLNWQFDVSFLDNFGSKVYLFHHFF